VMLVGSIIGLTSSEIPRARVAKIRCTAAGVHVIDRQTGFNLLVDEVQAPRWAWSRAPRQVSVAMTNACDLACRYCYAPKVPARLAPEVVLGWLTELDRHGCLGVGFGGGEPTLYPGFGHLCRMVSEHTDMAVTFTTHGHRLDDAMCADLSGYVNFIRVSMDGVGATYERLRGRRFTALGAVLGRIRALAPFGINYVVNADTVGLLDAAVGVAADAGAVEFLLLPEQPARGRDGISVEAAGLLREWVVSYKGPVRLTVSTAGAKVCRPARRYPQNDRWTPMLTSTHAAF
jgi:MoaA/NifB/PqqE/SkfB family radical SAM enzyme